MKRISFVIPVYRNERAVTLTYQQIRQVLASDLAGYAYEIVFVDDGSDDGSLQELLKICLLYTSPSPRDGLLSRMPSSA